MGTRRLLPVFCVVGIVLLCSPQVFGQSPFQFYAVYDWLADDDHPDVGSLGVAALSGDGKKVAYANAGSPTRRAYLMNADGSGLASYNLPSGTGNIGSIAISRDGSKVFFLAGYDQAIFKVEGGIVTTINLKGGVGLGIPKDPIKTTSAGDYVFFRGEDTDLWRVRADGSGLVKLIDDAAVQTTLGPGNTIWSFGISENASTIAFVLWGYVKTGVGQVNRYELYCLKGGNISQLTTDGHAKDRVTVSGDGSTIVFQDWTVGKYVSMSPSGGVGKVIAETGSGSTNVLTRDGGKMVYSDAAGGRLINTADLTMLDIMPRKLYLAIFDQLSISEDGSHILFRHEYATFPFKRALMLGHLNDRNAGTPAAVINAISFSPFAMVRGNPNASVKLLASISDPNGAADVKQVEVDHLLNGTPQSWPSDYPAYFANKPLDDGVVPDVVKGDGIYSSLGSPSGKINDYNQMTVRIAAKDGGNHYTVADMVLPVLPGSTMALTPAALRFAGTNTGGTLSPITGPQAITVSFNGPVPSPWTATANQSWVQITNGSGIGSGTFTVGIINPGNVLGSATTASATITVTASGATNSPRLATVNLTLRQASANVAPFGLVDTPLQNTAGVVGTIGVTGWVMDDVGVTSVKIYRNCLAFEPSSNCVTVAGRQAVFVGDATLVSGARPDVEALYPTYPLAYRAAWGYLLLTNLLPHVPNLQMFGGQGAMTFSALATDVEGKQVWLGRTTGDTTATTITLANDTIAKPFGAIDTPAQGATVSGTFANFGWALTPDANTAGGEAGDIVVPTNGSTLRVYLDGVPGATIAYNQCRGTTAAGPVPAGVWCNDDVASIFGHPTPQATFAARAANATKHRNLDVGRGAIGALLIDTTTLANGVHTIMWGVTDSAGRGEGLGSRYFTVLNAGGSIAGDASSVGRVSRPGGDGGTAVPPYRDPAAALAVLPVSLADIRGRTGFDVAAPWALLPADETGVRHVRIPDLGRLELDLDGVIDAGYLAANGERRDLPVGSRLEAATGRFTWAPGVGYVGTYRLVFMRAAEPIVVDVTIRPVTAAAPGEAEIRMFVDAPTDGAVVSGPLTVAGWALDPQAALGSGIDAVHVWARRVDVAGIEPVFLGAAAVGGARPDVAAAFGPSFGTAGFSLTVGELAPGSYELTVYVWNQRTARWEDARTVTIVVR